MFSGLTEIVQQLLTAKPFVPFEIWFAGGEGVLVDNFERARTIDEDGSTLAIYDPAKDQTNLINLNAVERIRIRGKLSNV
jgi:hypothetical protein